VSVTVCLDPIWQASQLRIREQLRQRSRLNAVWFSEGCSWIVSGMEQVYSSETSTTSFVIRLSVDTILVRFGCRESTQGNDSGPSSNPMMAHSRD
jgi:hypothetical protein